MRAGAARHTYSEVVDAVRAARARRLLKRRELALDEVAYRLGYAEPGEFRRELGSVAGSSVGGFLWWSMIGMVAFAEGGSDTGSPAFDCVHSVLSGHIEDLPGVGPVWLGQRAPDRVVAYPLQDGEPGPEQVLFEGQQGAETTVADIDADGVPDLLVAARRSLDLTLRSGATGEIIATSCGLAGRLTPIDLDADPQLEIVVALSLTGGDLWDPSCAPGGFAVLDLVGDHFEIRSYQPPAGLLFRWVFASDMDGDGDEDLVAYEDGSLMWFDNTGSGLGEVPTLLDMQIDGPLVRWDADGDGDLDLIVGGSPAAWLERLEDGWGPAQYTGAYLPFPMVMDVDADGTDDLVGQSAWLATGALDQPHALPFVWVADGRDLDGDGWVDLVAYEWVYGSDGNGYDVPVLYQGTGSADWADGVQIGELVCGSDSWEDLDWTVCADVQIPDACKLSEVDDDPAQESGCGCVATGVPRLAVWWWAAAIAVFRRSRRDTA